MISTDRQAFDRVLAAIPYKGAVLIPLVHGLKTEHLFPNHLISTPIQMYQL